MKRRLNIDVLEAKRMLTTIITEIEPNDVKEAATEVSFDAADSAAEIRGEIATDRDQDFFAFTASESGAIAVVPSGAISPKISVENGAGEKLFETDPNDGIVQGSFQVNVGDRVYVRVRGANDSVGNYSIQLTGGATDNPGGGGDPGTGGNPADVVDEVEPNDRIGTATNADLGEDGRVRLRGTSENDDDKDYFRIVAAESGRLNISVFADGGPIAKLEVSDAAGNDIIDTDPNDGINSVSLQVSSGQTLFLRLRATDSTPSPYNVDVVLAADTDAADLNGDGRVDASDIGAIYENFGNSGLGDINHDGIVDAADAGYLFSRWTG